MQVTVLGVRRMQGVGKASKQPYDMATLLVMQSIRPFSKEGLNISGYGFEPSEVSLKPEALEQFSGCKFPCVLDVDTDMENRGGKLQPVVIGIARKAA